MKLQTLQRPRIAMPQIAPHEALAISVECMIGRRCMHLALPEQELHGLGSNHAGAELYRHGGGWPTLAGEIDAVRIDEVGAMKTFGSQAQGEIDILLFLGKTFETEILLETHSARHENHIARAKTDGGRGDRRDAQLGATLEHFPANVQDEEIETVYEEIDTG